jgi:hypothetical protein
MEPATTSRNGIDESGKLDRANGGGFDPVVLDWPPAAFARRFELVLIAERAMPAMRSVSFPTDSCGRGVVPERQFRLFQLRSGGVELFAVVTDTATHSSGHRPLDKPDQADGTAGLGRLC